MAELNTSWDSSHTYIWQCDCHDWHYIEIIWDDEDADFRYLEIVDSYCATRWRDRFPAAWKMLRGKPHHHSGVILDEKTTAEIVAILSKHSKEDE